MRARTVRSSWAFRCAASGLTALAACLWPATARADDAQQFELVKGVFYGGQYEEVLRRLVILLDPSNPACATVEGAPTTPQTCHFQDTVLIERSREMELVALVALKRDAEADAAIEKLLHQNPAYVPDPASLPATVVTRVRDIKTRIQKEMEDKARKEADEKRKKLLTETKVSDDESKWIAELTRLASKETVIEKRSRLLAFVPFGVGQLQNGDTGWAVFFAATETVTAGASIGLAAAHGYFVGVDPNGKDAATGKLFDKAALSKQIRDLQLANEVMFATWGAFAIAGILQANLAYEPERRTTRDRKLPKRPAPPVLPVVAITPGAVSVSFVGAF